MTDPGISVHYSITQVQIHYEDVRRLPTEENDCSIMSQDECLEKYISDHLNKTTLCRPYWIDLSLPVCKNLRNFNIASKFIMDTLRQMDSICKVSCDFLSIRTGARNFEKHDKDNRIFFYFPYKVPIEQENYLINGLTLVAEIGGSAGLLLGICFYDFTEILLLALKLKKKSTKETRDNWNGRFNVHSPNLNSAFYWCLLIK